MEPDGRKYISACVETCEDPDTYVFVIVIHNGPHHPKVHVLNTENSWEECNMKTGPLVAHIKRKTDSKASFSSRRRGSLLSTTDLLEGFKTDVADKEDVALQPDFWVTEALAIRDQILSVFVQKKSMFVPPNLNAGVFCARKRPLEGDKEQGRRSHKTSSNTNSVVNHSTISFHNSGENQEVSNHHGKNQKDSLYVEMNAMSEDLQSASDLLICRLREDIASESKRIIRQHMEGLATSVSTNQRALTECAAQTALAKQACAKSQEDLLACQEELTECRKELARTVEQLDKYRNTINHIQMCAANAAVSTEDAV